ncbi:MAG: septum formation initiator family protein [Gemmatimonadetes bacterium]|nr:septum formation initiator family protein [Gemmatimonadota bacterium]
MLIAFLALVAYIAYGNGLLYKVWEEEKALAELEAQRKQLEAETDSLRRVLKLLESDIDFIEKVAREDLGLVKPGEVVIPLPAEEGE